MEIIAGTTDFYIEKETAVAIGKFDGVHIGHRRLLEEILAQKEKGLAACVFTFDPAPSVFFGRTDGRELTTREEKRTIFEHMGVDILIEFPLNEATAAMEPTVFAREVLANSMNARFIAAGKDLSFGAKGAGNAELLEELGAEIGFAVTTIDKVCLENREVSSSYIRTCVEQGDMELVTKLMGAPYTFVGRVEHGNRIGRTLGFPTVNLLPPDNKLLPPAGVYYSRVIYKGASYRAISNVGCKPTVTGEGIPGVESYLYDFDRDIYGESIRVCLYGFRRPERQFGGLEELKAQLELDIAAGENYN